MSQSRLARLPDGGSLSYAKLGDWDGRTPVILHRPLGGAMVLWGALATRLAARVPVLAFDPRGVGDSSAPPLGHGTREMALDSIALLDALGIERAHFFGLSLGGMVACWAAIDAPRRMDRLILVSTLPRAAAVSHRVGHHVAPLLRAFLRHGTEAEVALVRDILSPPFRAEHPARVEEILKRVRTTRSSHRALLTLALAAARHDASAELRHVRAPTLLLFGDRDEIAGRHAREELASDIPGAVVEMVADSGHDISLEQPEILADRVLAFLATT